MNKVYGFGFNVTYNNTLLKADVQTIRICSAFPPPYENLRMLVVDNGDGTSTLVFQMSRPCEKPTVTHQAGPAVTFKLVSIADYDHEIPLCANGTITLDCAYMLSKCGCAGKGATRTYYYNTVGDQPLDVVDSSIEYYWRPSIGDLNLDGVVDIQDLQALAAVYEEDLGVGGWGSLDNTNSVVDIFDFVVVAKYFGKPYECHVAMDGCWPDPV